MSAIDIMCLIALVNFVCISCFIIGVRTGQKVVKGEEVKVELPNPVKAIKEHKEKKEVDKIMDKLDIVAENIDNYDGTGAYQKEIPR